MQFFLILRCDVLQQLLPRFQDGRLRRRFVCLLYWRAQAVSSCIEILPYTAGSSTASFRYYSRLPRWQTFFPYPSIQTRRKPASLPDLDALRRNLTAAPGYSVKSLMKPSLTLQPHLGSASSRGLKFRSSSNEGGRRSNQDLRATSIINVMPARWISGPIHRCEG